MRQMALDGVLWIPTGDPPHKSRLAPASDRLEMVRLAIRGNPRFRASDIEIRRKQTTYTVDTLTELVRLHPGDAYVYIIGADTLFQLSSWHTFDKVPPLLLGMACVPRPGTDPRAVVREIQMLKRRYSLDVTLIAEGGLDISSTEIRRNIERGLPIDALVPEAVGRYIIERGLYRDPMLDALRQALQPERYRHTLGVERIALELAQKYAVDPGKARIAALLHDCAKCLPEKEIERILAEHGALPARTKDRTRTLMHAAAGAILAEEKYGVSDPEILSAIRWHTTGHSGMTALEKLIYLADVIEPNRRPFPALNEIRAATWRSLDEGMKLAAERTLGYLRNRGVEPDPHTLELLSDFREDNA